MKRLAVKLGVGIAALAVAALTMSMTPAAGATERHSLQDFIDDCVTKAAERRLAGGEGEAVIAECIKGHPVDVADAKVPTPESPITTGGQGGIFGKGRNRLSAMAESYWFCDSLNDDDCVWVGVETGAGQKPEVVPVPETGG